MISKRCPTSPRIHTYRAIIICALISPSPTHAGETCPYACGDIDGNGQINLPDVALFIECMGQSPGGNESCLCADQNGSGAIDLADFALLAQVFNRTSDEAPPDCTGTPGANANMTAYRPQHRSGYFPFERTAVANAQETDPVLGPGIRINAPGDIDPAGEDDLIEVVIAVNPPGASLALRRSLAALRVWTTRNKQPGTGIPFDNNKTAPLPIGPGQSMLTVWVEWTSESHGTASLHVEPPAVEAPKDTLVFHSFRAIVLALGGENQSPTVPVDPNMGTFVVGTSLYEIGYDVHMYDEDNVSADGTGTVYNEAVNAVQNRNVDKIAIFGYSHGGGSTHDLAERLNIDRPGIGLFEIVYTAYADGVGNNSDVDVSQERRRPPATALHVNHYQNGSFGDFFLDGGPVPASVPPPTGLDVETTAWGANATHFTVDDYFEVRTFMEAEFVNQVDR